LLGYRFFDAYNLGAAVAITQPTLIRPNESVLFVKSVSAGGFFDWWGRDLLPQGLKILPFSGFSLSKGGDLLYLWDAKAKEDGEFIDSIAYSTNFMGVSRQFDLATFGGADSVPGKFGAFRAQQCGDIGSPGYTTNPPPRVVSISKEPDGAHVKWRAVEGKTYALEYNSVPRGTGWTELGNATATNSLPWISDPGALHATQRFYRVEQLP
jgi:hypothetical protein